MTAEMHTEEDDQLHPLIGLEQLYLLLVFFILVSVIIGVLYWNKPTAAQYDELRRRYDILAAQNPELARRLEKQIKPPIITLTEAQGFRFALGSAEVTPAFYGKLTETIIPQIIEGTRVHGLDLVEVVGHTDEVRMPARRESNLDWWLLTSLSRSAPLLVVADNVGLGMARAATVTRLLRSDERLKDLTIAALSAGQTIFQDGRPVMRADQDNPQPNAERRRIEIRLRKLGE